MFRYSLKFLAFVILTISFFSSPINANNVLEAQKMLTKLGHAPGPIDGSFGDKTKSALENYYAAKNKKFDLRDVSLDDKKTFQMLSSGSTTGVFQLESAGMKDVLIGLKPDRFEDIIAVVSLYRPGPMENIPTYINRKHGKEEIAYMHPDLEEILDETYGIFIYQEQVLRAAQILANFSLGSADILRRAMGKKDKNEMFEQKQSFLLGAKKKNINV